MSKDLPQPPYKISQSTADSVLPQSVSTWGVRISLVAPKDSVSHLYQMHSAVCCRCAWTAISKQSGNHASQYPTWNSWTHWSVVWSWAVSEGDIEENRRVTRWHLQSLPSSLGCCKGYLKATWASVEDDHTKERPSPYPNHEEKHVSFIVENQGRADQANTAYCTKYTQFSNGEEDEVIQWPARSPDLNPYMRPDGAVYQRYG